MGFNDEFALQKILNGPCPLWVLAVVISFVLRRADNCHSARLQAHPHRLINRTKFFWKKIFWKNRIRKCVDKAEIGGRYRYLTKA